MSFRYALKGFIDYPERYTHDVIFYDSDVVIVRDKFPKSQGHLLVMPRDSDITDLDPTLIDNKIKSKLQPAIDRALDVIYKEFHERYGLKESSRKKPFLTNAEYENKQYFIDNFTQVGIHGAPSMNNLHVHIMTRDFKSPSLKNKKHFNSFTTEFFVNWVKLPLNQKPDETFLEKIVIKQTEMKCVYCGQNFKNRFSELKLHLDREFTMRFENRN
ncbi:LAMI_0F03664g1_1 [Lachancea mirantina]|uniref:LAMI_0F03664g1_1 n=1 Tax=Lachancea mirantina TaxID=1230905 RepID=A0A1G4JXE1_9SACH|nr:LAMI_0F03664g1_1 [Lachancea mirantina]